MFNLALSLHLGAVKMKLSPTRSQQLERARRLYELAFQLHGEIEQANTRNSRFMFAITNNLGHVLKCLQRHLCAAKCFEQLLGMIMYVVVDRSTEQGGRSSSEDVIGREMDGYLRNTSHLVLADSAAAAA
jgi:hypothetical protein